MRKEVSSVGQCYTLDFHQQFILSNLAHADIEVTEPVTVMIEKRKHDYLLNILSGTIYLNTIEKNSGKHILEYGDIFKVGQVELIFKQNEFQVLNGEIKTKFITIPKLTSYLPEEYPEFHKAPRIMERIPEQQVLVEMPPSPIQKNQENIVKIVLPPVIMLFVSGIMMLVRPRGIYILATMTTTIVSLAFSIQAYLKGRKQYKKDVKQRLQSYTTYLENKIREIHKLKTAEHRITNEQYPTLQELAHIVLEYQPQIYMRGAEDSDFLTYKLGNGAKEPSFQVTSNKNNNDTLTDPLEAEATQLVRESQKVEDLPVVLNLQDGAVGYIGDRELVLNQITAMLTRLGTFHSYHDVQLIACFKENEYETFSFLRWLPHIMQENYYNFVFNEKSRDIVLNHLLQTLKDRETRLKEQSAQEKGQTSFYPHYVLVMTDQTMVRDHPIMEYINKSHLGLSLVYVEDSVRKLPATVKTVVEIRDSKHGRLVSLNGHKVNQDFQLEHLQDVHQYDFIPRYLAGLEHVQTMKSMIPEAITFLEMYDVETVEDLNVEKRWAENEPYKSLAVPLGVNGPGQDDIIKLNLHEKAHGPHGLVAGTTGSGKSEIIQSYILSLAVNFHPDDVAFLLIDYKGGGMANLFKYLPHLLGSITNLDASQSMRALISIKAELKRRQQLFADNDVNHINQYQKLYNDGKVDTPMPHLFLISDEFAELKAEQPEFMDELISTARIGRSLGIHLILATQKPAGVVNDQIWSNSKFKLALKVADRSDSMEMIKTPDAAEITQPGRAYLQVGNNEVYELFQSAWSGADYRPNSEDDGEVLVINEIDKLGMRHTIVEDLSGLSDTAEIKAVPTELEAVIDHVKEINDKQEIAPLPRPWLPPLSEKIEITELIETDFRKLWQQDVYQPLQTTVGMLDIPSRQIQENLNLDLTEDGNLVLFASAGYGKSTFLQTLIMNLARKLTPSQVHFYLLDFGTNGLLPVKNLPHVADLIQSDEEEKIGKFNKRIRQEIKRRKAMLSEYSVANMEMYYQATGVIIPEVIVVLDNYEGYKDMPYQDELYKVLVELTRMGPSIGMHLVTTAATMGSFRTQLLNNIKERLVLKQNNETEFREIVGRSQFTISDMPGRGLIKREEPLLFQVALPTKGETSLEVIQNLEVEIQVMDAEYQGPRPTCIPMMPEDLFVNDFIKRKDVMENMHNFNISLGLDFENIQPVAYNPRKHGYLAIVSDNKKYRKQYLHVFIKLLQKFETTNSILMFDLDKTFSERPEVSGYYADKNEIKEQAKKIIEKISDKELVMQKPVFVIVTDTEIFAKELGLKDAEIELLLTETANKNIHFVFAGTDKYFGKTTIGAAKIFKENNIAAVILSRLYTQSFVRHYGMKEPEYEKGTMYFSIENEPIKAKYPEVIEHGEN